MEIPKACFDAATRRMRRVKVWFFITMPFQAPQNLQHQQPNNSTAGLQLQLSLKSTKKVSVFVAHMNIPARDVFTSLE